MNLKNSVKEKVYDIIEDQLQIKDNQVEFDKTLEDLGADSIDRVEIVMKLEEAFNKEISDKDAENLTTIKSIIDYLS